MTVINTNAEFGEKLHSLTYRFVTVPQVFTEIRDPVSRHRFSSIPFTVNPMEPTPNNECALLFPFYSINFGL
uniref:Ribonuclease PIN domain-containing protein n=1 Tax=Manihot esculenta TaxID=3983 RepID=A0A2C9WAB4_MANES